MREKKDKIIFGCLFIILIFIGIYIYQSGKDNYNFLSQNNKQNNLRINYNDNNKNMKLMKKESTNDKNNKSETTQSQEEEYQIDIDILWSGVEKRTNKDVTKCNVILTSAEKNIYSYSYKVIVNNKDYASSGEIKLANLQRKVKFPINKFPNGMVTVEVKAKAYVEGNYTENTAKTIVYIREKLEKPPVVYRPKLKVNLNGGKTDQYFEISYESGSVIKLANPTQEGCIFTGWKVIEGDSKLSKNTLTIGTEDTTISAKWKYILPTESYKCKNKSVGKAPYAYEYTGNCQVTSESNDNWEIKFLTSGKFKFGHSINIDVFLVGGGSDGTAANHICDQSYEPVQYMCILSHYEDGSPGTPGNFEIVKDITLYNQKEDYEIKIGNHGLSSSAFGYSGDGASGKHSINKFGEKDNKEVYCQNETNTKANTGNGGKRGTGEQRQTKGSSGIVIIRNARRK